MERFDFVCDLVDTLTDTSFGSPLFNADDNMRLALEAFGIRFDRKVKVGTILVLDEHRNTEECNNRIPSVSRNSRDC